MPRDQFENVEMPVVAIVGSGLIGCSWAALIAATGRQVLVFDSRPDAEALVRGFWDSVHPELVALDLATPGTQPRFEFCETLDAAVSRADFVLECIPERLEAKLALYRAMEPALKPGAIVATSSSGLKLSDLQAGWTDPGRLIIGHPFNPPHLVPLVELFGNDRTDADVLPGARALYESCGKVTITLHREVMGHVANRLQAAIWREAIHLVDSGVVSVRDVNAAVWAGPGLRWAVMGPHMLLNLGGGEGGLRAYCQQFSESYAEWWKDLGQPSLDAGTIQKLVDGLADESGGRDYATLRRQRDAQLVAVLRALSETRAGFQKTDALV
ncbi:3-hydroxybutyryl-CoA dehydrogenase [Paracoccus thiocyanatus]|uniref:3-hydroxybutyryl-CoA dehydrogenase n=1 Tax=Paracoccus thiocyanatus TaxID=34006 RepID=A0A1N6U792_9RHOB|nr:3-hydroxyacyl-CoA dehydrogenase NAD-binding domain-containing protein [Paracoccus thiocyanatus]SIQ61538.1 3-hydroxybutyryl-CoA dehydrogenase [Paracoccus thiocyanatus]